MRKHDDEYEFGTVEADEKYDSDILKSPISSNKQSVGSRPEGFRAGTLDRPMKEAEQPGGIADQSDQEVRNAAIEEFANKIKKAVSSKLMGRKVNLKLKGHKDLVSQVVNMIKLESEYLNALIIGQAADTPSLQKNKAIIDSEAKKLDRMLGTSDFWPFK